MLESWSRFLDMGIYWPGLPRLAQFDWKSQPPRDWERPVVEVGARIPNLFRVHTRMQGLKKL